MTASFRFINPVQQYLVQSAVKVLAGGSLYFYESGTSTPLPTYTDASLGTQNPNPVPLDASGVPIADIWMSGSYRVVLKDALGATLWTADDVEIPGGSAQAIPSFVSGQYLTNDGTDLVWQPIVQVPDMSAQAGKYLSTDGTNPLWKTIDSLPNVTIGDSGSIVFGNVTLQWGKATLPASGANTATVDVTFGTAFSGAPYDVQLTQNAGSGVTASGGMLILGYVNPTNTGFTCNGDIQGFNAEGSPNPIIRTTTVVWLAIGPT